MTNEEIAQLISKGIVLNTGGIVNPREAQEFVDMTVDQTALLREIRVETGIIKSLDINNITIGSPVLRKGVELQAAVTTDPSFPKLTLTPVEATAAFDISYSWLRKNVRRESANEDLNRVYAKRVGKDMIILLHSGDITTSGSTPALELLKIFDGWLTRIDDDNTVHDVVIGSSDTFAGGGGIFDKMLKKMPKDYRDAREDLIYLVSQADADAYEAEIEKRETNRGDEAMLDGVRNLRFRGIKVMPVFGYPSAKPILTLKENLVAGFGQEITVYQQNFHRQRKVEVTMTLEIDGGYLLGDAIVIAEPAG